MLESSAGAALAQALEQNPVVTHILLVLEGLQ